MIYLKSEVKSMIFNISGRCDIVAFYYPWLKKRLHEGYVDVRHPFDKNKIFRYPLNERSIDALVVCTKNPLPILQEPQPLLQYPTLIQITITPYGKDLEPYVVPKKKIIEATKQLSQIFGRNQIDVRYDPIVLNEKYTIAQHIASFEHLVQALYQDVHVFIISFVDEYKNTKKHGIRSLTLEEMNTLAKAFGKIAKEYNVCVQTCGEAVDFSCYGIKKGKCIDKEHLNEISGRQIEWIKEKSKRPHCECADYRDIGVYNACPHYCKYCYANFDEKLIDYHYAHHDPESSLLVGQLEKTDKVIEISFKPRQITLF